MQLKLLLLWKNVFPTERIEPIENVSIPTVLSLHVNPMFLPGIWLFFPRQHIPWEVSAKYAGTSAITILDFLILLTRYDTLSLVS
jgi:hypothetical protein